MSTRERQIQHLNHQLGELQRNLLYMSKLCDKTATQFRSIKNFSELQASVFMSSHAVFQVYSEKKEARRQELLKEMQEGANEDAMDEESEK
ncbi:hypothetical protein KL905_001573 [Ogataea polymorpha]|nr:hypothetical protein KL937_002964 [Ogataea polymorpha]KAG7893170.1 hypothetical protein KL936_001344 [Ogataea polymorpha]KAG7897166.1 hypothetical protein KL908_000568 [Ogataea polymorpha]KAG7903026.1 hypothetical protein KL935_000558 [Ogataea polymorpha]KAG7912366.1 hypothetical protein KL906_000570 [Ogataea polymorpha]